MEHHPGHYIQNHVNWCWAIVAQIVGIEYCLRNHMSCQHLLPYISELQNSIRNDQTGLRPEICDPKDGKLIVDVLQQAIVEAAKDPIINPAGNLPEGDEGKARALRYVITGDPHSYWPEIILCGHYLDSQDLLSSSRKQIEEAMDYGHSFIGNYERQDGSFHSVVLRPVSESRLELYDPWDGYQERFTLEQIFRSGFLTNQGAGVISWIQYIQPDDAINCSQAEPGQL